VNAEARIASGASSRASRPYSRHPSPCIRSRMVPLHSPSSCRRTGPHPSRAAPMSYWTSRVSNDLPRYLIHDRDSKYTLQADSLLEETGTKVIRLPVRSPDLNGYTERWIRSLRQECLDRIIILNKAHLLWVLRSTTTNAGPISLCSIDLPRPLMYIHRRAGSLPARCSAASSATTAASPRSGVLGSHHDLVPLPRACRGLLRSSRQTMPTTSALRCTSQPYQGAGQLPALPNPSPDEFWDTTGQARGLLTVRLIGKTCAPGR